MKKNVQHYQNCSNFQKLFCRNPIPSLNLFEWPLNVTNVTNNLEIIDSIVRKFHNQTSIKMIKNKLIRFTKFSFQQVISVDGWKAIKDKRLDKSLSRDITADIIKQGALCLQELINCINQSIARRKFHTCKYFTSVWTQRSLWEN